MPACPKTQTNSRLGAPEVGADRGIYHCSRWASACRSSAPVEQSPFCVFESRPGLAEAELELFEPYHLKGITDRKANALFYSEEVTGLQTSAIKLISGWVAWWDRISRASPLSRSVKRYIVESILDPGAQIAGMATRGRSVTSGSD